MCFQSQSGLQVDHQKQLTGGRRAAGARCKSVGGAIVAMGSRGQGGTVGSSGWGCP